MAISQVLWVPINAQLIERYCEKRREGTARLQLTVSAVAHIRFCVVVIDGWFNLPTNALTCAFHAAPKILPHRLTTDGPIIYSERASLFGSV